MIIAYYLCFPPSLQKEKKKWDEREGRKKLRKKNNQISKVNVTQYLKFIAFT